MAKIPFNVSAKTARLIGRENVSNLEGALIELIKNTYDADAKDCILYYEKSTNRLFIIDNGCGMSQQIILNNWMTIGKSSKFDRDTTKNGRINTGEKGIGRFALDRISERCNMLTIGNDSCFEWIVNWEEFEVVNLITDTYAELVNRNIIIPEYIGDIKNKKLLQKLKKDFSCSGTCFILTGLRDEWNETLINKIKISLQKLLPPMESDIFSLYLYEEESTSNEAKIISNLLNEYDYKIHFELSKDSVCSVKLYRNEFYFGSMFDEIMKKADFSGEDIEFFNGTPKNIVKRIDELLPGIESNIYIGPLSGDLYFYKLAMQSKNKEKYFYKDFITKRNNFKDISGIKIYRDNFLVRPYGIVGITGYDWLDLSTRKAESPATASHSTGSWKVQANQICGQIYISRLNKNLPDKSSREGIVETTEFQLFRELIKSILSILEDDRQYVIRKLDNYYKKYARGEEALRIAKNELSRYTSQKQENDNNQYNRDKKFNYENFQKAIDFQEEQINELQEEMGLLRTLATTGIVVNTYIHEIKALTTKLNLGIKEAYACLNEDNDRDATLQELKKLRKMKDDFNSWFKVTLDSVELDKRKRIKAEVGSIVKKSIENWRKVLEGQIEYNYIEDSKILIRCFPFDFESIINNLVTNSSTKFKINGTYNPKITIETGKNNKGYFFIKYSDNGPGISKSFKNNPKDILKYGITDKRNANNEIIGTGMGLWIVNNIIQSYNGYVDLLRNKTENCGFYIDLYFKGREN